MVAPLNSPASAPGNRALSCAGHLLGSVVFTCLRYGNMPVLCECACLMVVCLRYGNVPVLC